jgi:hypothetical protein
MGYDPSAFIAYGINLESDEERYDWDPELPEWFFEYDGFSSRLADILEIPEDGSPPEWDRDNMSYNEYCKTPERMEWQARYDARKYPLGLEMETYGDNEYSTSHMLIIHSSQILTEWKALKFDPMLLTDEQYTHDWEGNIEKALQLLDITLPDTLEIGWHLAPYYG